MSSLIEDIEKAKDKKNQLVGNSQFDPKRGNSNEVRNTLIYINLGASCILPTNILGLFPVCRNVNQMMSARVTVRKWWRKMEKISFFCLT